MNLGLLEGWAAGGPVGPAPAPAGAAAPIPPAAEGAADPAFRTLMVLFAVPMPAFRLGDSAAKAGVETPVFAGPPALSRTTIEDAGASPISGVPASKDEDERTVEELLAGLFACTQKTPLDRVIARPDVPAASLTTLPAQEENAGTTVPASTPCVSQALKMKQPDNSFVPQTPAMKQAEAPSVPQTPMMELPETSSVRPTPVKQPEISFELPQAARASKVLRQPEHPHATANADLSGIVAGAATTADAPFSQDREQSESEPRKQTAAMPMQAAGRAVDADRNAAMPEFSAPAARPTASAPLDETQSLLKSPLKTPAPSITFTLPIGHAAHAMAASRMHAATSIHEPHAAASLPANTAAQIVQTIQLAWFRHGGEARITLDPQQFGDLTVAMRVDRGVVVARLQADAPQVREWLHANQDSLRAGLAEQHLRLDQLEITATDEARGSEKREAGQRDDREPPPHPRRSRRHRPDQLFEIDA